MTGLAGAGAARARAVDAAGPAALAVDEAQRVAARQRILVCHEDRLVGGGIARELEIGLGDAEADVVTALAEAVAHAVVEPPDMIVCSDHLCLESGLSGVARRFREAGTAAPLLVLAQRDTPSSFEAAVVAGAAGYLPLVAARDERLPEVAAVLLAGRTALRWTTSETSEARLTPREHEVLLASDRGLAHKQIAAELGVAVSTVKTHARAAYEKLGATSRTDALYKARADGLI